MTTLELSLLSTELASARVNATLGASHVDQVRRTASINGGGVAINIRPLHLAIYHFNEAAKLIDQALGKEPMPALPTLADYVAAARKQAGLPEVISPSPAGSADMPSSREEATGEGDQNIESSVTLAPSAQDAPAASSPVSQPLENAQ